MPWFVAYGLYFLYILVDSIWEYIVVGATFSEWLGAIPGWFLIVVFGSIFATPGLLLACKLHQ